MVSHPVLLDKMLNSKFPAGFILWLKSYLSGRSVQVKLKGTLSRPYKITIGVPQGSVLGPSLFCALIGDLPNTESEMTSVQYADDINIIMKLPSQVQEMSQVVGRELERINNWCTHNHQTLNLQKSKMLLFTRSAVARNLFPINTASSAKILGVTWNEELNWKNHIDDISKKACKRLHVLRVLRRHVSTRELHEVYNCLIRSVFEYCCPLFCNLNKEQSVNLQRIDNRAHRMMSIEKEQCGCGGNGLKERREALSLKLFRKIILDKRHILHKRLPRQLKRNRLSNFYCRTKRRQRSFFPNLTLLWNQQELQQQKQQQQR